VEDVATGASTFFLRGPRNFLGKALAVELEAPAVLAAVPDLFARGGLVLVFLGGDGWVELEPAVAGSSSSCEDVAGTNESPRLRFRTILKE